VIFCVIDEWIDEQLTLFRVVVDAWSRAWHAGGDDAGDRAGGGRPKEQLKRKEQRQRIAKLADLARQLVARERDDGPGWTSCSTSASWPPPRRRPRRRSLRRASPATPTAASSPPSSPPPTAAASSSCSARRRRRRGGLGSAANAVLDKGLLLAAVMEAGERGDATAEFALHIPYVVYMGIYKYKAGIVAD